MSILYLNEHCSCFNYSCDNQSIISEETIRKGKVWEIAPVENILVFVLNGELGISFRKEMNQVIAKNKIMLLTSGTEYKISARKDSKIMLMKMLTNAKLCERYSFEKLFKETKFHEPDFTVLDIKKEMSLFLKSLAAYLTNNLRCSLFFEIKVKELFYLLRGFYTKDELFAFFYPLLSNDLTFSDFVKKNYMKAGSVTELAKLANYSLSGFVKRFKKVFGVSVYQWMKDQKAELIFHEINNNNKSLKEIGFEFGFSSPAHFNDFCKTCFGKTPGAIRKSNGIKSVVTESVE